MRSVVFIFFFTAVVLAGRLPAQEARGKVPRDPFWPVGYEPKDTNAPVVPPVVQPVVQAPVQPKNDPIVFEGLVKELEAKIRAQCQIRGFMKSRDGRLAAVVNDQVISLGDRLAVAVDGKTYYFKATAITPTAVKLEPVE